jgi:hypothetical protein
LSVLRRRRVASTVSPSSDSGMQPSEFKSDGGETVKVMLLLIKRDKFEFKSNLPCKRNKCRY